MEAALKEEKTGSEVADLSEALISTLDAMSNTVTKLSGIVPEVPPSPLGYWTELVEEEASLVEEQAGSSGTHLDQALNSTVDAMPDALEDLSSTVPEVPPSPLGFFTDLTEDGSEGYDSE